MVSTASAIEGRGLEARQPARIFLLASGVFHIAIGSAGFLASTSFGTGGESGHLLGVFETNALHNLSGLGLGLASLAFASRTETARLGALSLGATMIVVTAVLAVLEPGTLWLARNGWDQVLHALAGVGGLATGLLSRPSSAIPSPKTGPA